MSMPAEPQAVPQRWWPLIWGELRVALLLAFGVAVFLALVFREPFGLNLIYSLCIGLSIQGLIEGGRYGFALWQHRRRGGTGRPDRHWPGWAVMGPWVAVSIVAGYTFGALVAGLLTNTVHLAAIFRGEWRALAMILPVVLAVSVGATYHFYTQSRLAAIDLQVQAARRAAAENQLKLLESQLEPHMLFNTLANLRVLIATDPPRAQDMLDRLISFLRATLSASRTGRHTLRDEFARLGDYLALMAVRMGPRMQSRLDLPDELAALAVPPLLLQPLVENSIKHGLEPRVEGGTIHVSARRDAGTLVLEVVDSGAGLPGDRPPAETGFGLHQVRERLATLYGNAATLQIVPGLAGGTSATVRLPLENPP